jgi:hypothetical protein
MRHQDEWDYQINAAKLEIAASSRSKSRGTDVPKRPARTNDPPTMLSVATRLMEKGSARRLGKIRESGELPAEFVGRTINSIRLELGARRSLMTATCRKIGQRLLPPTGSLYPQELQQLMDDMLHSKFTN